MSGSLVGRDGELARLRAVADPGLLAHPRFVVVEGEAGIGKTSLFPRRQRRLVLASRRYCSIRTASASRPSTPRSNQATPRSAPGSPAAGSLA